MSNHDYKPGDWVQHKDGHVAQHKCYLNGRTFMKVSVPNSGVFLGEQVACWKTADCRPAPSYRELVEAVGRLLFQIDRYVVRTPAINQDSKAGNALGLAVYEVEKVIEKFDAPEPEPKKTTPTPRNEESGEITLKELEKVLGVKIENTGRACSGAIKAQFPRLEIKDGAFLGGGCGYGNTFEDAVRDYLPTIEGWPVVLNSSDPKSRREYILPARIRVGDYFEPEPDYKWLAMDGDVVRIFIHKPSFSHKGDLVPNQKGDNHIAISVNKPKWLKPCQLWEHDGETMEPDGTKHLTDGAWAWNGYWWRLVEDHSTDNACDSQNAGNETQDDLSCTSETQGLGVDWIAPEGNVYEAIRQIQGVVGRILLKGCK